MNFVFCWINVGILLYLHYEEVLVQEHFIWTNLISFRYGGGGIRTHGALADTLVFKPSRFLVIPIGLNRFKEIKLPKVSHFIFLLLSKMVYKRFIQSVYLVELLEEWAYKIFCDHSLFQRTEVCVILHLHLLVHLKQ